jgi:hypothetical protein
MSDDYLVIDWPPRVLDYESFTMSVCFCGTEISGRGDEYDERSEAHREVCVLNTHRGGCDVHQGGHMFQAMLCRNWKPVAPIKAAR